MFPPLNYDRFHELVKTVTLPTMARKHHTDQQEELVGSCFVCKYGGILFVLNAGHTVDTWSSQHLYIMLQGGLLYPLPGTTKFQDNGKMDIAITPIPPTDERLLFDNGVRPFDLAGSYRNSLPKFNYLTFFGYPCSKHEPLANTPRAHLIRYSCEVIRPPFSSKISRNIDPEYHIVGTHNSGLVDYSDEKGQRQAKLPKLEGMSGGPVFWYDPPVAPLPHFAGIGVKYVKGSYVAALKVEAIIAALNSFLRCHNVYN